MRRLVGWGLLVILLTACGGSSAAGATRTAPPVDAAALVTTLRGAGLPVGDVMVYTAASDPNALLGRPGQYVAKVNFLDTRLERQSAAAIDVQDGGSLEVFATATDAKARLDYLQRVTTALPSANEYDTQRGLVILRLSHRLTPDQAAAYQQALATALP